MIYEYAVSPLLFSHPSNLPLLFQAFEGGSGRLISDYPRRKWLRYAREYIKQSVNDQVDQRACIELLMGFEKKRVMLERQGTLWDDQKNWINNAIDEHRQRKFRAILNDKTIPAENDVIGYGPAISGNPLWPNPGTRSVLRQAPELVKSAADLIGVSTTLVLVDRNFIPSEARFLNVLKALAEHVRNSPSPWRITQIKYVTAYEKDRNLFQTPQLFEKDCNFFIPSVIPAGIEVKFIIKTKALLHKRLIMTDRGAILFEHGLDEGQGSVLLARLSADDFENEWSLWNTQQMHSFTVIGTKI